MMNDNLFKHSILLDLSLSLSDTNQPTLILKNILVKIIKSLNCCAGGIYMTTRTSEDSCILRNMASVPHSICKLEDSFKSIINVNHEYKLLSIKQLFQAFPMTILQGENNYYHFLPLGDMGMLFLEKKDRAIDNSFLKMLNPILVRIADVIINNIQKENLVAFRNLFEAVGDYVVMYDRRFDQIIDGNNLFWDLLGRKENPPLFESVKKFIEINGNNDLDGELDYALAGSKIGANKGLEGRIITPERSVPVSIRILCKREDNSDKMAFIMKDLSLRDELARQKIIAEESQRLAGLGEMAGNIAHEINNPLAIIAGSVKLVNMLIKNAEFTSKHLLNSHVESIEKATQRISTIITSLKRVSRDGALEEIKPTFIYEVIHDALDLSDHRLKQNSIKLDYEKKDLKINCRLTQISQVIVNLLNNSIYAVKELEDRWIKIVEMETSESVKILVMDSGKGIPSHIQAKMMQKYFTSKPSGEGTGIGLSLSKELLKKHGGDLYYDNNMPNTTFVLEFPKI